MSHAYAVPPRSFAPWAEIVPGAPRATADSLLVLRDDGWQYEVVEEDILNGEDVVPEFTYAVAKLFA